MVILGFVPRQFGSAAYSLGTSNLFYFIFLQVIYNDGLVYWRSCRIRMQNEKEKIYMYSKEADIYTYMRACMHVKSTHWCPALCDPIDCSPPGSSVHGIVQARIPE